MVGTQALPWARLGLAQIQLSTQQTSRAMCTLELLILEEPEFADAYDVMGRAQLAQGDFEDALETYRNAAALTPASVHRQQALGTLAYYCGDHTTATRALERAMALGQATRQFDHQALGPAVGPALPQRRRAGAAALPGAICSRPASR